MNAKTRTNQPVEGIIEDVNTAIANGEVDNAKPIYYHPIEMKLQGGSPLAETGLINIVILDNNPNAYDKTALIEKLQALMDLGALINANGYVKGGDNVLYNVFKFAKDQSDVYRFYGNSNSTMTDFSLASYTANMLVTDGVNKIN